MTLNAIFVAVSVIVFIAAAAAPTLIASVPPLTLIAVGLAFFAASALVRG